MQRPPLPVLILLIAVAIAVVLAAAVYLAGQIALPLLGLDPKGQSPWVFVHYWMAYPELRQGRLGVAGALAAVFTVAPLALLFLPKRRSLHGDAKFATELDVKRAGLYADKGIVVGRRGGKYLVFGGQEHVLMAAPTRSGKGVGVVIPTLLNWSDSAIVLDIKQENWDITAGYRAAHGHACYLFNPAAEDLRTCRYNPLDYLSDDPAFRINDAQKIASMLYPDLPNVDPIWNASCRTLFVGIVLYLKETPGLPCTFGEVLRTVLCDEDTAKHLQKVIKQRVQLGDPLSRECVAALNDFITVESGNTRSSIRKTFTSRLDLWLNPIIDAATSASDFNLRDVRKKKMSIYVGITPDNLSRLQPVINLLFQQLLDINTREMPQANPELKHSCLLLMDEFAAIGRIEVLTRGVAYIAGYNLRLLPIIQSPAQIREIYGKDAAETFMTNHALKIIFAPHDFHTAKEISDTLGTETVKATSESKAKNIFQPRRANVSTSDQRRPLLLPQEVSGLGRDAALLMRQGCPPIQATKVVYYTDPTFKARLMKAPNVTRLAIASRVVAARSTEPDDDPEPNDGAESTTATTANDRRPPESYPTTEALIAAFDPFADPPEGSADAANGARASFDDFSLDFDDVELPKPQMSDEDLRRLHQAFLQSVGESPADLAA